ncbi:MAG TPA: PEP-CTERM sorting domain-containing protein [Bryobacteraceae bacterium]|nr:PEP-CTERM sorting domain-containing protein [Bryobacteraceae bacterium]
MKLSAFSLAIVMLACGVPASASLIVQDSPLDGASSVVLDTDTGLYWLKPSLTDGESYATVQAEEGQGNYTGFTLATYDQVRTLFLDGGIQNTSNSPSDTYYASDLAFIDVFGPTRTLTEPLNGVTVNTQEIYGIYLNQSEVLPQDPYLGFVEASTYSGPFSACYNLTECGEASVGSFFGGTTSTDYEGAWLVASSLAATPVFTPEPATFVLAGAGLLLMWRRRASRGLASGR